MKKLKQKFSLKIRILLKNWPIFFHNNKKYRFWLNWLIFGIKGKLKFRFFLEIILKLWYFNIIKNLHKILKEGGYLLLYVPFLYRYHAPKDLSYQDFFRFTKDGLAYLLRDFSEVTLYPIRRKYSTMLNLSGNWKNSVEKKFNSIKTSSKINIFLDRIFRNKNELIQVSGYNVWARK